MNKIKLGAKNVIWGIVAQIVTIGLGIIIPRLVLVNLGSESNGLMNSISSVLTYLSLLEAGVGTATIQALYRPIADKDRKSINAVLSATHYFYRRTGYIYLAIVIVLSVLYTCVVETTLPRLSVFLVVILSGLSGVLSYFFQGKYKLLLSAEGKGYINTNITTITHVFVSITKAIVLISGGNVVAVQTVYFIYNLIQVIFFVFYILKNYQWIDLSEAPDFDSISQKNAVLMHQIASLIFYNTDTVILTVLTSLKVVSVYSMYAMIFGMVKSIAVVLSDSFVFALGQSFTNKEKFMKMFNAYEVYNITMTFSLYCVTSVLILPFLQIYTRGVTDINYVDRYVAILFLLYYLMDNGRKPSGVVINIAQHFEKTKWRAIIEATINLSSSLLLTYKFGIYGVLLGTIIALLYRANDMIIYASKIIERSPWDTYKKWIRNIIVLLGITAASRVMPMKINSFFEFLIWGAGLSIVIVPIFILINSALEPESAKYAFSILKKMVGKK